MSTTNAKRFLILTACLANLVIWAVPSRVVQLIARNRQVILGRYSREHFTWILIVLIVSAMSLYVGLGRAAGRRKRSFQLLAVVLIGLPVVVLFDAVVTLVAVRSHPPYVLEGLAYHRPPRSTKVTSYQDRPASLCSYPDAPDGFGTLECTLTIDDRGYRNRTLVDRCDVLVLGDSFAEGSRVSDDQAWPVLLAERSGLAVYNLGMSGYDPQHYLAALQKYGPVLRPELVICMLYEGNDFRSAKWVENPDDYRPPFGKVLQYYVRHSRIIGALDGLMTGVLGALNADADVPGIEVLAWLPLRIESGIGATYYAFTPKRMVRHYVTKEEFREDEDWKTTARILGELKRTTHDIGAELLIAYASDKPHVMMPLAAERLPAEQVRGFAALREDNLPEANVFLANLLARLGSKETVTREYCLEEDIFFVSTTAALQARAGRGEQVYYTYDQHWTPVGHEVVADVLYAYLQGPLAGIFEESPTGERKEPRVRPASASGPRGEMGGESPSS
jgi:hypothetical protein